MTSVANLQPDPAPVVACTISRDVQNFELLIDDMEQELGENWGDLSFEDAAIFLEQPDAGSLQFVAVAVDDKDEADLTRITEIIRTAKGRGIRVVLIADQVSPVALHQLLRLGADDFVPYPLPEGALHEAIERIRQPAPAPAAEQPAEPEEPHQTPSFKAKGDRDAVLLPVHGLAGGTGASTFAANLAWELATIDKQNPPRVCLLDLDLQFGAIATYLDLPRREAVFEILQDTEHADSDSFLQAMITFNDRLHVFTAPSDMLPLDIIGPEDVSRLLDMAMANFDFVIVDMPKTIVAWTETVLSRAHVYFGLMELDLRSAQNVLRLTRALKAEGLPHEKLRFVLNRAPKFTDLTAKSRVKRMAESLDISIEVQLPDGGAQVTQSNDHGLPLSETAAKNPLRKEIGKLAKQLFEVNKAAETSRG
ncbi:MULTISPECIES: pilus assembly protein CpaE [Gemmobacter]|jgi:pilus assembly protein CpaE|uniref:Pilus assembly protein CpaE n=2 Tax=Gemmobacter TaxID=204456 RepID=A0A2T6B6T8_9RHOB|nr:MULTISPECIES: pilus assembly protein CpaE [Gemmobacter]OJY33655.1 MAG: pilus assembly protein CpaE [Rhodobacterales bacterium 65-51]PTX51791.1 pilus assembly protein CpaE [Gemmobacter caeni]TWJ03919.1 pilus assembly protein CpaE [Gemmobacter caeni]GHC11560.1 pilus assembly protein CpaE [Gemmobacter nanjingensis]